MKKITLYLILALTSFTFTKCVENLGCQDRIEDDTELSPTWHYRASGGVLNQYFVHADNQYLYLLEKRPDGLFAVQVDVNTGTIANEQNLGTKSGAELIYNSRLSAHNRYYAILYGNNIATIDMHDFSEVVLFTSDNNVIGNEVISYWDNYAILSSYNISEKKVYYHQYDMENGTSELLYEETVTEAMHQIILTNMFSPGGYSNIHIHSNGDKILIARIGTSDNGGKLISYNVSQQKLLFEIPHLYSENFGDVEVYNDKVIYKKGNEVVCRDIITGNQLWSYTVSTGIAHLQLENDKVLLISNHTIVLSLEDGSILYDDTPFYSFAPRDFKLYNDRLYYLNKDNYKADIHGLALTGGCFQINNRILLDIVPDPGFHLNSNTGIAIFKNVNGFFRFDLQ